MREFALANGYGSEVPAGCTYMATLNGIGEFTFGSMSGWMYTTMPEWNADGTADYLNKWFTPPVGAADYTQQLQCADHRHDHPSGRTGSPPVLPTFLAVRLSIVRRPYM